MNNRYKKILIIAGIVVALVLIWYLFIRKKEKPVELQTAKPTHGYIALSVTATGRIQPVDTVSVGSQISGQVKFLYADFNSTVKKGQKIAEIDKSLLQASLDQAKGNLANNRAQLALATANYGRENLLYKTDAISKAEYDNSFASLNSAKASVAASEAQVRSAEKNLSYADIYSPIDGVVLNRSISVGQTVAASFNTPTLFIIARDIKKMQVQANVDEADIGDVKKTQRVSFTVDAFINDQFKGTVEEIRLHPTVSANVVTYTTIIDAPNDDMKLKPGMTANIVIYTHEVNNAMLIPAKALKFVPDSSLLKDYQIEGKVNKHRHRGNAGANAGMGAGGASAGPGAEASNHTPKSRKDTSGTPKEHASVWVLQGKKLIQKRITIGLNDNTQVQVLKGLTDDDQVITSMPDAGVSTAGAGNGQSGGSPFMPQRRRSGGGGGGGRR